MKKWLALFAALSLAYACRLGSRALWDPDEGRYAEIAHEMLASGDWVTPRFNGVVYLEKPPLLYWLTATSFRLLGREERWTGRIPLVLATLLTCGIVAWTARRRLGEIPAFWATLAYGSCFYVFILTHVILTDGLLTLGVTTAFAAMDWGRDRGGWGPPMLLGLGLGLGILAKGPVAVVLPCLGLGMECLLARSLDPVRRIQGVVSSVLVTCAVVLPWFVLEARAVPSFPRFFIVHENLRRFATHEAHREAPFWIFPLLAVFGWYPWWGALWTGLRKAREEDLLTRSVAWAVAILLFFSISKSKLPPYIWPTFPPLALVVGWGCKIILEGGGRRAWRAGRAASLLMGLGLALASHPALAPEVYGSHLAIAPAGLVAGVAMSLLGGLSLSLGRPSLLLAAVSALLVQGWLFCQAGCLDDVMSTRDLSMAIRSDDPRGEGVIVNHRGFRPSLPFYTLRRVVLWGSPGELTYGMNLLPSAQRDAWFFNTKGDGGRARLQMQALWGSSRKVYLVVRAKDARNPQAVPLSPPGRVLYEGLDDAVLVNR